jgi:cellulose synthase/poly-beta-1,6-N-acetylglucosamine synthase-like glycosyltransferase/peptidoglycan/xylan/chitin deacetylase (PgdA/CDA1 family)/spore germination protein YaaH
MPDRTPSVFLDPSGKRWRAIQRATLVVGVGSTIVALGLGVSFLIPPILPNLQAARLAVGIRATPRLNTTRVQRERSAAKRKLTTALARTPALPARRAEDLLVEQNLAVQSEAHARRTLVNVDRPRIVAGFYVNWDDNSFASFKAHATAMDWVICEWSFLTAGGDSLKFLQDNKVLYYAAQLPPKDRPRIFAMVSNFDSKLGKFDAAGLRRLLATAASRQRAAVQLVTAAQRFGLAGITLDFEEVPDDLHPAFIDFMSILRAGLAPGGRMLTAAVAAGTSEELAREFASHNDYLFLMLYDEHFGHGDPGPVASQAWYVERARRLLQWIPADRAILALGAYGYHWDDSQGKLAGRELTFQDVMERAHASGAPVQFDSVALNPSLRWTDPDGTDHVVWFLDGVTAWNQARAGFALHTAGAAIWRLGSEDPSLWSAISNDVPKAEPAMLEQIPAGYDVEFDGNGELLRLTSRPTPGRRFLEADPRTQLIRHERITQLPMPWVVQRFGADDSTKLALTFDDGPDPRYTPAILDTLRSRGVKATFFVVGRQADEYPALMRRLVREGHEVGNHTYTHPNLSLTNRIISRLEIVANGRLIETIINRRTALFRPPYFGDAEPTTTDELEPIGIATDLGYLTVGVHIDSEDWHLTNPDSILKRALEARERGNVVLLHDSGGDRSGTVAMLGRFIDRVQADGDQVVLVSELAGISRDEAMPPLTSRRPWDYVVDLLAFGAIGAIDWALYWVFLAAVILGVLRLAFIMTLALIQRYASRKPRAAPGFAPPVTVIVPAFREERVIVRTVESLLAQDYTGELDIIVVDDGSPDATCAVATGAFAGHPRVQVFTKPNGGKATALNFGIALARADIVVCLDADTQFERRTISHLVAPLADPGVGAVAGNAKVGNRVNLVTRWQALEYVTSQNLDRRAFSLLNCITVIPGAVGAWRKVPLLAAGGFTDDTLAEDQDLTIRIRKLGYRIAYAERAIAWTEAPETLAELAKQRFRWSFGTLQCAWKHKGALFNPRYGTLGFIALPNTWLFQLLLTSLSPLADLLFAWGLLSVWLNQLTHGDTYALTDLWNILAFFAIFLLTDWLGALIAFMMEPDEERGLSWLIMLQRFVYRQIMYSVVLKSFVAAIRGRVVGWGQLERKATVELPA